MNISPQTRPDLKWLRLGRSPVVYAYQPARGDKVWVFAFHERTGAALEHLCATPSRAGRWVTHFAQQNP